MMRCPPEFVKEVIRLFPEWLSLHDAVQRGAVEEVEGSLSCMCQSMVNPLTVIELIDKGMIDQLRAEARLVLDRIVLYFRWIDLVRQAREKGEL